MHKYKKPYFLILLFIFHVNYILAQLPGMRKYSHLDGFTATNGYLINQDEKGYLWIGTDNGGIRFDGNKFKELQQFPTSSYMEITSCQPLGNDRVLLSPLTGEVIILDHEKIDTVKKYRMSKKISGHNFSRQDAVTGAWWIYDGSMNDKQLTMYVYKKNDMVPYTIINTNFLPHIIIDNHLIGVEDFILKGYDLKSRRFYPLKHDDGSVINDSVEVFGHMIMAHDYLLTHDKKNNRMNIYKYTVGDSILHFINSFVIPFPSTQIMSSLSPDNNQYIYFADSETGKVAYYPDIRDSTKFLFINFTIQDKPNSLFIDKNNNLWLTTANNALYFLSEKHIKNMFASQNFLSTSKSPKSISGDNKETICISYKNSREVSIINGLISKKIILNGSFIEGSRKILSINNTDFLVYNKNLALIDKKTGKTTYLNAPHADYKDVCRYQDNEFLAASNIGISYIYLSEKNKYASKVIYKSRASTVDILNDGKILIGTPNGLYTKSELNAKPVKLTYPLIENSYITDIVPLTNGNTLIGTNGQGLLFYKNNQSIQRIKLLNGNILSSIRQLYLENDSTVWASTNIGGIRVSFDKTWSVKNIRQYTFYDGLPSNNVTGIYVKNDTVFFATPEGMGVIPIQDTNLLYMAPPILSINRFNVANDTYVSPEEVFLLHNQNNFQILLSGVSYESQGKIEYYYRLYPLQEQWIKTNNPEIQITNAAPADYIFQAYSTNAKDVKSNIVMLKININKAFWQTHYFKIIVLSIMTFTFYFLIRRQIQKTEREKYRKEQQKKHLAQLELEAIKAQINPHFIHNCLNSIQYLNYSEDYTNAQKYLDLFSQLIRKTMDYARRTFISVEEEMEYLSQYMQLEKLRFKEKFDYEIDIDSNIAKDTQMPAMLLQPYVENAVKHGVANKKNGGKILVQFRKKKSMLQIIIKDNGPGFSQVKKNGTMGLRISGTRAQSYNDLFNLHIQISSYNVQDKYPDQTGAIVKININTIDYETAGN